MQPCRKETLIAAIHKNLRDFMFKEHVAARKAEFDAKHGEGDRAAEQAAIAALETQRIRDQAPIIG